MTLQAYTTQALQRELQARRECVDCGRERPVFALKHGLPQLRHGWKLADEHRYRCPGCHAKRAREQPTLFKVG